MCSSDLTGSYRWIAPAVTSDQARVAVVQIHSADASGYVPEAEISESGTFTIAAGTTDVGHGVASFSLGRIAPNPAGGPFDVSFSLSVSAPATLSVYDVSGRRVAERAVGGLGTGVHSVRLGDRERLRPGLYLVRLSQEARSLTTPVLIVP